MLCIFSEQSDGSPCVNEKENSMDSFFADGSLL